MKYAVPARDEATERYRIYLSTAEVETELDDPSEDVEARRRKEWWNSERWLAEACLRSAFENIVVSVVVVELVVGGGDGGGRGQSRAVRNRGSGETGNDLPRSAR